MKTDNKIFISLATFAIIVVSTLSWSMVGEVKVPLMAMKKHPNASGVAIISDKEINIEAKGLQPNAVYTVWFVNMKPKKHETGAGTAPYMFRTDSSGKGTYYGRLTESPFGKWQMVMIVLHPNGDPKDMKNMVGALSAKL